MPWTVLFRKCALNVACKTACAPTKAPAAKVRPSRNPLCSKRKAAPVSLGVHPTRAKPARHRSDSSRQRGRRKLRGRIWGVFQCLCLVHWLAFRPLPPPRLQISHAIQPQGDDWCAVRAVARCELGLLPVLHTGERVRVCSGEVGGAKDGVRVSCVGQGSMFLSATRTGVQMPRKRRKSWTADIVCGLTGRELGVPALRRALGSERRKRRDCCRRAVASAAFSDAGSHLHPSPPVASLREPSVQNRLALRETILPILEVLTCSRGCSSGQSLSGERSSVRRSLPART